MRKAKLARDVDVLKPYLIDVADEVNDAVDSDKNVLVEGTQGFGLSLLDHNYYPFVTSQDTTASPYAAGVGIGPRAVDEVLVLFKAYVTRVGKGPMRNEWPPEKAEQRGIEERGTVSGRLRRIGDFDTDMAIDALRKNTGTRAAVTCIDRLFDGNTGVKEFDKLTPEARDFIWGIDAELKRGCPRFHGIALLSTGPNLEDTIDLRVA